MRPRSGLNDHVCLLVLQSLPKIPLAYLYYTSVVQHASWFSSPLVLRLVFSHPFAESPDGKEFSSKLTRPHLAIVSIIIVIRWDLWWFQSTPQCPNLAVVLPILAAVNGGILVVESGDAWVKVGLQKSVHNPRASMWNPESGYSYFGLHEFGIPPPSTVRSLDYRIGNTGKCGDTISFALYQE